jgi:hypothetical protein
MRAKTLDTPLNYHRRFTKATCSRVPDIGLLETPIKIKTKFQEKTSTESSDDRARTSPVFAMASSPFVVLSRLQAAQEARVCYSLGPDPLLSFRACPERRRRDGGAGQPVADDPSFATVAITMIPGVKMRLPRVRSVRR